jgi:UDP-glucose 4-epimerase
MYTLVTGGAGFLGTSIIKSLMVNWPHMKIVSLDDYSIGLKSNHIEGVHYIEGSCRRSSILLKQLKFDTIYHFGEYSHLQENETDIKKVQSSCLEGTSQIIRLAIEHGAVLIYSTSQFNKKDLNPSPYTYLKKQNVDLIKRHQQWSGLKSHIFYFFNAYGPGQITEGPYATILGIWQRQIEAEQSLTMIEPGIQMRIFTRVESITSAITKHYLLPINREWSLDSEDKTTLLAIAKKLNRKTKWIGPRSNDIIKLPKITWPKPPHWEHPYRLDDWIGDLRRWTAPLNDNNTDI